MRIVEDNPMCFLDVEINLECEKAHFLLKGCDVVTLTISKVHLLLKGCDFVTRTISKDQPKCKFCLNYVLGTGLKFEKKRTRKSG